MFVARILSSLIEKTTYCDIEMMTSGDRQPFQKSIVS